MVPVILVNIVRITLLLMCIGFQGLHAAGNAKDFLCWTQGSIAAPLSEKAQLIYSSSVRWKDDATHPYFKYDELGVSYKCNDCWTVTPAYRRSYQKNERHWEPDNNFRLIVTRKWSRSHFKFSDRNIIGYRSNPHQFRYRNRLQVEFPSLFSSKLSPILSNEIFLNKLTDYSQNRLQAGLKTSINDCLQFSLGYMFLVSKSSTRTWYGYNVLWSNIHFNF